MIALVDYGMGNLRSVINAFGRLGAAISVSDDPEAVRQADKIVLPGVGAFGDAMAELRRRNLVDVLHEAVIEAGKPVLGICLGMQLLARHSEEGDADGLGWIAADVVRMRPNDRAERVPHIGWNDLVVERPGRLLDGIGVDATAYFVHSYHMVPDDEGVVSARTEHGGNWVAAVESGRLFGAQFHPEKSHDVGLKMLANFAAL